MNQAKTKPVRLEVNRAGAWKSVMPFDAADEHAADQVMAATQALHHVGGGKWRICTDEALPCALMYLDKPQAGWVKARGQA